MPRNRDDLSSFKIGDRKRPEVRSFSKTVPTKSRSSSSGGESQATSVGFELIERRLETSSIEAVADELRPSYEQLEALQAQQPKLRQAARKAMAAYERAADLFEYLFATKAALAAPAEDPAER